jgi:hypothetical protein
MSNNAHPCYQPHLYMPVVAPPPAGATPESYYAQLATDGITVGTAPTVDHDGIQITVTYPPQATSLPRPFPTQPSSPWSAAS